MANRPSIPKGTRDFLPAQSAQRQFIFDTARSVFELYGYQPIETPAMENLETLTGKYGEEGDRLIFKILNNGHFLQKVDEEKLAEKDSNAVIAQLCDRALRYDLTVPFARFVVQHQNELNFPFKRYQIQPVWRADRPQRGRYREFYQCDVDVIGSDSLLNEAELISIINDVFTKLKLPDIQIRINNRKVLSGIANASGLKEYFTEMTVAIDKLDKVGIDGVKAEMLKNGLPEQGVKKALDHINRSGDAATILRMLSGSLTGETEAQKGIDELKKTLNALPADVRNKVQIDLTLARGLNYYTGAIIEVGHEQFPSSICGGGRYDDLTGIFGLKGMSGVGVSFGADRIYDLMEQLSLFDQLNQGRLSILFGNFGDQEAVKCTSLVAGLRKEGHAVEVYPDAAKMQKQMKYANARNFDFVVLIGTEEEKAGTATVKNMQEGAQSEVQQQDLAKFFMQHAE